MGEKLLSRFNPMFANVAGMEGELSLRVEDLALPLGESLLRSGRGSGHLDLSRLSITPKGGLLNDLLQLLGGSGEKTVQPTISGVDFVIADGRVSYDNFDVTIGELDLRFSGSVGFDDQLKLNVSVPLNAYFLKRFGMEGQIVDIFDMVGKLGTRVEIPIRGTRKFPKLEMGEVDFESILADIRKRALQRQAQEAAFRVFDMLGKPSSDGDETGEPDEEPPVDAEPPEGESQPAPAPPPEEGEEGEQDEEDDSGVLDRRTRETIFDVIDILTRPKKTESTEEE
jgi:hypothetical protein